MTAVKEQLLSELRFVYETLPVFSIQGSRKHDIAGAYLYGNVGRNAAVLQQPLCRVYSLKHVTMAVLGQVKLKHPV